MFYTIYWVCILSVRVSVIRAILVCSSITKVILKHTSIAQITETLTLRMQTQYIV